MVDIGIGCCSACRRGDGRLAAFVVGGLAPRTGFRVEGAAEVEPLLADVYAVVSARTGPGLFRGRAAVLFVGRLVLRLLVGRQDFLAIFWLGLVRSEDSFVREGLTVTVGDPQRKILQERRGGRREDNTWKR